MELKTNHGIGGFARVRVMNDDGTPASAWSDPIHNLVLPAGFTGASNFFGMMVHGKAGTGSTPNSVVLDGTFSQTGTTVTRTTGTGVFSSGNVNDFIKFGTGERAKITAYTNTVTVTVDRSQTVAAAALTVYDCSRITLDTYVASSNTYDGTAGANGYSLDADAGTTRYWRTYNFATEVAAKTYTEVGIGPNATTGQMFSRVVLDSPVNVGIGQFLQLRYDLLMTVGNCRVATPVTVAISGWPYSYAIQSITSNGTYWDVVVGAACSSHFATGRPITIAGAIPVASTITTLASTGSDFTVTTGAAHNKNPGDSIVIAGATPSGYNGTWTVATTPTSTTLTVTSAINPGAGSGGTLRLSTPGTWYDGTHTIASFPNSTTIRITNASSIVPAGISGTVKNNLLASAQISNTGFWRDISSTGVAGIFDMMGTTVSVGCIPEANLKTGIAYGVAKDTTGNLGSINAVSGSYDSGNRSRTWTITVPSASWNNQTIRQIAFNGPNEGILWLTFEERQRKDNGFQLVMSYTLTWEPDLA